MLSRTNVLKRMLKIRKSIYNKELTQEAPPSIEDVKIKKEIDKLIKDIIGDFLSKYDSDFVDKIILKAICDEITIDMAIVAIKEIVLGYYSKKPSKQGSSSDYKKDHTRSEEQLAASYYQKGYR